MRDKGRGGGGRGYGGEERDGGVELGRAVTAHRAYGQTFVCFGQVGISVCVSVRQCARSRVRTAGMLKHAPEPEAAG